MDRGKRSDRTAQWILREASGMTLLVLVGLVVGVPVVVMLVGWLF